MPKVGFWPHNIAIIIESLYQCFLTHLPSSDVLLPSKVTRFYLLGGRVLPHVLPCVASRPGLLSLLLIGRLRWETKLGGYTLGSEGYTIQLSHLGLLIRSREYWPMLEAMEDLVGAMDGRPPQPITRSLRLGQMRRRPYGSKGYIRSTQYTVRNQAGRIRPSTYGFPCMASHVGFSLAASHLGLMHSPMFVLSPGPPCRRTPLYQIWDVSKVLDFLSFG